MLRMYFSWSSCCILLIFTAAMCSKLQPNPSEDNVVEEIASSWVPMLPSEAFNHFTRAEVCRAFRNRPVECSQRISQRKLSDSFNDRCTSLNSIRTKKSTSPTTKSKFPPCPYAESAFFRHSSSSAETSGDFTLVDVILIMITQLHRHRLVLVGDSISRQQVESSLCELLRRGYSVDATNPLDYVLKLKHGQSFRNYTLTKSDMAAIPDHKFHIELVYLQPTFWPSYNWPRVQEKLERIPPRSAVVIMNMGLHLYHPNPEVLPVYENQFEMLFNHTMATLLNSTNRQLVFYRESSAQHFPTFDGSFYEVELPPEDLSPQPMDPLNQLSYRCHPFRDSDSLVHQYWRNALAIKVLRKLNILGALSFSAFSDVTSFSAKMADGLKSHMYPPSFVSFLEQWLQIKNNHTQASESKRNVSMSVVPRKQPLSVADKRRQLLGLSATDSDEDYHLPVYHGGITLLSFYMETSARYDLHSKNTDCSHFCQSPMLWLPIWQQLILHLRAIAAMNYGP